MAHFYLCEVKMMNQYKTLIVVVALLVLTACQPTPLPAPTNTPTGLPATPATTSDAVTGSVVLADGSCCAGGLAGSTVNIKASFQAASSAGNITEMRIASALFCQSEAEMAGATWEPFAADRTIPFANIPINWVGFYVSAQFRDSSGNVSAVYCDDISVEGMPPVTP